MRDLRTPRPARAGRRLLVAVDGARRWPACRRCSPAGGRSAWLVAALVVFLVAMPLWSRLVEGRRAAVDRLGHRTDLDGVRGRGGAAGLAAVRRGPQRRCPRSTASSSAYSMLNVIGDEQGGIFHALLGTLLITLAAAVISVPIGILTADLPRGVRRALADRAGDHLPRGRDDRHPVDRGRPVRPRRCSCCCSARRSGRASAARSPCRC